MGDTAQAVETMGILYSSNQEWPLSKNALLSMSYFLISYEHQIEKNADLGHMLSSFPSERNTIRKPEASTSTTPTLPLDCSFVWQRGDSLRRVVGQGDRVGFPGKSGLSLDLNSHTVGPGLLLGLGVGLDSLDEVLTRSGGRDVLDSDVDALLDVAVLDLLVDDDADRALGNVVDDTGLAVVDLEGHAVKQC